VKRRPPTEVAADLERYGGLLRRYHGTLDLMSDAGLARLDEHVRDAEAYVDVLAGLSPAPARIMDLGAGAGLPGIVVAVTFEGVSLEMVERRRKRAIFLRMVAAAVGGAEVEVRSGDVRSTDGAPVEVVLAQAVGTLDQVYALTRHRHAPYVVLMSRKGPEWRAEIEALEAATGAAFDVVADASLARRGTLVAVRAQGGLPCRSSV